MDLGIRGRSAVVLCATAGIGRACAEALAEAGVHLVLVGRRGDALTRAAGEIRAYGNDLRVETATVDLTDQESVRHFLATAAAPDILVQLTPRVPPCAVHAMSRADIDSAHRIAYGIPHEMISHFSRAMVANRFGRVVCVMGTHVRAPVIGSALQGAPRGALLATLAALAKEVAFAGVTINVILAGPTNTEGLAHHWSELSARSGMSLERYREMKTAQIPLGRLAEPQEIAVTAAFFCAARAGAITGQSIVVDGGSVVSLP